MKVPDPPRASNASRVARPLGTAMEAPRALAHPIPAGMRDLLPAEARQRRSLAQEILRHFRLHGYAHVMPPTFEFAEVLERGLGTLDPSDVLRFVEPESGEVAALRPDMTPQLARIVATRLRREPGPIRLCYEGTAVRRRQGRARKHRQLPQAGVELYGVEGREGDLEILRLMATVLEGLALHDFVIDLGHASIVRPLLEMLPSALASEVTDALAQKDGARVGRLVVDADPMVRRVLPELVDLHGGGTAEASAEATIDAASRLLSGTPSLPAVMETAALWEAARRASPALARTLRLDFGEVRGFAYYTGPIFHVLAKGPGEPVGAGGRYDDLLARFNAPMPAVGFALYLDALAWAREAAGVPPQGPDGVVVATQDAEDAECVSKALRAKGIRAVAHVTGAPQAYARAWDYSHVVTRHGEGFRLERLSSDDDPAATEHVDLPSLVQALEKTNSVADTWPPSGYSDRH